MKIYTVDNTHYFKCPGCHYIHSFNSTWEYNNDPEKPTVAPSLLINGNSQYNNPAVPRCHSFIKDGQIQFLEDCSHDLAGETIEIPDWERGGLQ